MSIVKWHDSKTRNFIEKKKKEKKNRNQFFLICIFPYLDWIRKYGSEKSPYSDIFYTV